MEFATPSISWEARENYSNPAYFNHQFDEFERSGFLEDEDQFSYSENLPKDPYTKMYFNDEDYGDGYGGNSYDDGQYGGEGAEGYDVEETGSGTQAQFVMDGAKWLRMLRRSNARSRCMRRDR